MLNLSILSVQILAANKAPAQVHECKKNSVMPFQMLKTSPEYTMDGVYGKCML